MSTNRRYNPKTNHWETPNRKLHPVLLVAIAAALIAIAVFVGMKNRSSSIGGVDSYGRATKY